MIHSYLVCVSCYNKQTVTGQLLIHVNSLNVGGQSSLMLPCPKKLRIREGSIHWPWMIMDVHLQTFHNIFFPCQ